MTPGMNDARLVDFASLLRQNGLRVSPGEVADAARALALVPFDDREAVRSALRATLVKRGQDAGAFDRLFELYFGAMGRLLEGLEESLARALSIEGLSLEDLQELARMLDAMGSPLGAAVAGGDLGAVAKLLRTAALQVDFKGLKSPLQKGFYARRVASQAGIGDAEREFGKLAQALAEKGFDPSKIERVSKRLEEAVEALEDAARRAADLEQQARDREKIAKDADSAAHRNLASLSPAELAKMRDSVKRLAEKLKSRISRRRKERRRGQLHVRRTLRMNLSSGGIPAKLAFRQKRPERPDIVVLCDVSDSVRNVSRLMLQFVHTLQSLYARVRSFVFVSDLGEVTKFFKDARPDEIADDAFASRIINLSANSNYGRALRLLHADFRGAVTRRTTVVVIGDGRSNHNPAEAWVLEDLKRRARRIVWVCPEEKNAWGIGDSEMHLYARHCDQVLVVRTLDDLAKAAEQLLP